MMKYILATLLALTVAHAADAQSIILRDDTGNIVNGDTIEVSPHFIQKPPYTNIDCKIYAQNNTGFSINLGAKKAEHSIDPDAYHAICFETQCFTPGIYVAPVTVPLAPMGIDSTFKGGYKYIVDNHVAGKYWYHTPSSTTTILQTVPLYMYCTIPFHQQLV